MKVRYLAAAVAALFSTAVIADMVQPPQDEPAKGGQAAKVEETKQAPDTKGTDSRRIQLGGKKEREKAKEEPTTGTNLRLPPLPDEDFKAAARANLPLSADQIRILRRALDDVQRASAEAPGIPANPVSSSYPADLAPGATPPVVRLSENFVTSMVFVDSTGAPWPIVSYAVGGPENFDAQDPDKKGNALTLISKTAYGYGNLSVFLQGLNTPVTVTLVAGQKQVDYRADIRVKARGPNAVAPLGDADASVSSDPTLLAALDGVMPATSRELNSNDPDLRAWSANGKMYIRTRLKLMSPAWTQSRMSPDGMNAYVLRESPVLVTTSGGREKLIKVTGFVWNDPRLGRDLKQVGLDNNKTDPMAAVTQANDQTLMPARAANNGNTQGVSNVR